MVTSFVDLCNQALIKLGASTILDLSQDTKAAKLCALVYLGEIDTVLRTHGWNCATSRKTLAPLTAAPAWGYSASFQLPSDCLRLIGIDQVTDFRREGKTIVCNETALNILYIRRITDPTEFDDLCADAIACRIAWKIAYAMTESVDRVKACYDEYRASLRSAKFVDSSEDPAPDAIDTTWLNSRSGINGQIDINLSI